MPMGFTTLGVCLSSCVDFGYGFSLVLVIDTWKNVKANFTIMLNYILNLMQIMC